MVKIKYVLYWARVRTCWVQTGALHIYCGGFKFIPNKLLLFPLDILKYITSCAAEDASWQRMLLHTGCVEQEMSQPSSESNILDWLQLLKVTSWWKKQTFIPPEHLRMSLQA